MEVSKLLFAVNGERFEISNIDPSTTLLEFLRTRTRFTGPKLGCGEGGCGACVVLLSTYDVTTEQVNEFSVSSCLTLLCSINLCSVTTSEGLGNSKDGFHPVHKRFAGFHASQCGFCTPGMCMSFFSAVVNADKTDKPAPPLGFSKITKLEAEKSISGNLCRCTGYRPIIDACRSFATDVDLEDLGLNTFWEKGENAAKVDKLPKHSLEGICTYPEFLKSEIKSSLDMLHDSKDKGVSCGNWYRPNSLQEVHELLNSKGLTETESRIKIVVGNTGSGVYKEHDLYDTYIDLKGIEELSIIKKDDEGISLGATVTISRAIGALKEGTEGVVLSSEKLVFVKIADHMNKVASPFVRNTASLGGNLVMSQRSQFASDIATILLAAGSTVCLQMPSERLVLTLEEFLSSPPCEEKTILVSIHIPCRSSINNHPQKYKPSSYESTRGSLILFETYRASPRPLGNAVAYLNSAFLAQVVQDKVSGNFILDNIQLAFGAYGSEHAIRARKVEKLLVGKNLTPSLILEAVVLLKGTIVPREGTPHASYRTSLAVAFFFKFFQPLFPGMIKPGQCVDSNNTEVAASREYTNGSINGYADILRIERSREEQKDNSYLLLSSKQELEIGKDYNPVGEPIKKFGAEIQASGDAIYVDDIPSPKNCLYGAFVYSTNPLAYVKGIKFSPSLASEKLAALITANDIPKGGQNIGCHSIFGSEPLFADSLTEYAGQPVGIAVAETQRFANLVARQAIIDYSTEDQDQPILTVEDAVKRSSYFQIPPFLYPKNVGDFAKGMGEADHKISSAEVKLGSQYYFYMETQTVLAVPDEDNCIVVYSSTQNPEITHGTIAKCLGIPNHNVRVITRRVGGGFGGKALRSVPVAAACAIAAFKLRRPVRMYLDRRTDMIMIGGRHPMKVNYSVGFKSSGQITALHIGLLINAGISEDISPILPRSIIGALNKYNWGALSIDAKLCKTNLSTKSAMRAPGDLQGTYIAEAIIEHVASFLSMDANSVRRKNLHSYESLKLFYGGSAGEASEYTLPSIYDKLALSDSYFDRLQMIHRFNDCNKWRKRGISCVPIMYQVELMAKPGRVSILSDGSIVVETGGIEIGQGLWTKVKQMTALCLEQLWGDRSQNLLERVRVIQADSLSLIQGGFTGGSTASESSCEAVRLCCNALVERLKPLKERQNDLITWDALISQASMQFVNLSASSYWVPDRASKAYLNYGAAITEVEVDVLTGAATILRTDITYDCGKSLNPAVDLGQIEGAFVQGIGFFMSEEYVTNQDGLVTSDGTWTYKIPTVDTIPKQLNVEILNSGYHEKHVLSSKASGEPPLLLAASVHCALREAIRAARKEFLPADSADTSSFQLEVPATMPVIKEMCGLDNVESYLKTLVSA